MLPSLHWISSRRFLAFGVFDLLDLRFDLTDLEHDFRHASTGFEPQTYLRFWHSWSKYSEKFRTVNNYTSPPLLQQTVRQCPWRDWFCRLANENKTLFNCVMCIDRSHLLRHTIFVDPGNGSPVATNVVVRPPVRSNGRSSILLVIFLFFNA